MNVNQIWPFVAIAAAVVTVIFRQMSLQRSELNAKIDGVRGELRAEINGVRTELKAEINGVRTELKAEMSGMRNEIMAALQHMGRTLERLDEDLRDHVKKHPGPS